MAMINLTATDVDSQFSIMALNMGIETRFEDPEDETTEQYRNVCRLIVFKDAYNVTGCTSLDAGIVQYASFDTSFNGTGDITLTPGTGLNNWRVVNQEFTPFGPKGALTIRMKVEMVTISSAGWSALDWST